MLAMPHGHHFTAARVRRRDERRRQLAADVERVVSARGERARQTQEEPRAAVQDRRGPPVHGLAAVDGSAERETDGLMTETDAEDRSLTGPASDHRDRDARLLGSAWPGRHD